MEDKVEALKSMLACNEKHEQDLPLHKDFVTKTTTGVKECLQVHQETQFQMLISELRNTVINSYWNKEVGKTRYHIPNLPMGMNPLEITFGKKLKHEASMAELLRTNTNQIDTLKPDILEMYRKSHNHYQPAEQIKRNYMEPFNSNLSFGKSYNTNTRGAQIKKTLTWINFNPTTVVNSILADFKEHSHSCVGEVRNLKKTCSYMSMAHGKANIRNETTNILADCPLNNDVIELQKYLQYVNSLRQKFKKHVPEIPFLNIYEELSNFDKDYARILPEDIVFTTAAKYKMYINKILLIPLLDLLQIRKEKHLNYTEFLNLLNWKFDFPTLPKVDRMPLECQYYNTVYRDTIGNVKEINTTSTLSAGVMSGIWEDKTATAYSLISPTVFTKHGLSYIDLTKLRSKEEIKSIFENIGVEFPDNSFTLLWEQGLKKDGTQNLCVETFRELLDQNSIINKNNL
ncbi:EF-hand domain-containing family member B [Dufourea novaeangliae]|uniref:EF-hand domain-containing family member B n=2 Tax=Dufourea novaeangliae TaxID=178035 RepID=A0A154P8B8_DUFNO|nr:EF-hand domain-containing family member B [Dufourea novaeangliae]